MTTMGTITFLPSCKKVAVRNFRGGYSKARRKSSKQKDMDECLEVVGRKQGS